MQPTKELIDALFRDEVLRARRMPPEEKLLAGARLFEYACQITAAGIRNQFPEIDAVVGGEEEDELAAIEQALHVDELHREGPLADAPEAELPGIAFELPVLLEGPEVPVVALSDDAPDIRGQQVQGDGLAVRCNNPDGQPVFGVDENCVVFLQVRVRRLEVEHSPFLLRPDAHDMSHVEFTFPAGGPRVRGGNPQRNWPCWQTM